MPVSIRILINTFATATYLKGLLILWWSLLRFHRVTLKVHFIQSYLLY